MPEQHGHGPDLRDYARILRRGIRTILVAIVLAVAIAVALAVVETPRYATMSELLLQPRTTESLFDSNLVSNIDRGRAVQTEIRVVTSERVRRLVRERIGAAPRVSVSPVGQTDVIQIRAESTIPRQAATVANAYAQAYIDFRRSQAVDDLLAAGKEIQTKLDDIRKQLDALNTQIASAAASQKANLEPQRDSLVGQQALFEQRLDQIQVDAALRTGGAQLVTSAGIPSTPVSPRPVRSAILGLFAGAVLGVGVVIARDYFNVTIRSKEDAELILGEVPILALVPKVPSWKHRDRPLVVSLADPSSPAAEAYRTLRTSLQFMAIDRPIRTIQVTSAGASEGKTTTIANLVVALRRAGQRVIAVDCDLRRPRLEAFFDSDNDIGFTSVLLGEVPLADALQVIDGDGTVYLLAAGPPPPNPSELLGSPRTKSMLDVLRGEADIVLVDSPPVVPVTDALLLAGRVDATLLVVTVGSTTRTQLRRALELLEQVDTHLVGCVLNGTDSDDEYAYVYQYLPSRRRDADDSDRERLSQVRSGEEPFAL